MNFVKSLQSAREQQQTREVNATNAVRSLKTNPNFQYTTTTTDLDIFNFYIPKIELMSRNLSLGEFESMIPDHTDCLTITDYYRSVTPPDFKREGEPNLLIIGIVGSKSEVRTSANGHKYIAMVLCDLVYDIQMQLYGKAFEQFYKLQKGTVIAVYNPKIYMQNTNVNDRIVGSPALSVSDPTSIIEIGQAKYLGQCEAQTSGSKFSKTCKNWVNLRKSKVCDFHTQQVIRTKRPELNSLQSKIWDPRNAADGRKLTVVRGGEVKWKRGLQLDAQDLVHKAPRGRIFQSAGFNKHKYDESFNVKKKRLETDKELLRKVGEENDLRKKLEERSTAIRRRVEQKLGLSEDPELHIRSRRNNMSAATRVDVCMVKGKGSKASTPSKQLADSDTDSDLEIIPPP